MSQHNLLKADDIKQHLTPKVAEWIMRLETFNVIDSTNLYLATHLNDYPSGSVCFADEQTAGKGRRGREWISPLGQNIYGSFLWHFTENVQQLSSLSLAIGVGIIRVLNKQGIWNVGLKWPNDIYSQMKKLGGILIEMVTHPNGHTSAIIGLGINISLPEVYGEKIGQAYTDLQHIAPLISVQRHRLIADLLNELLPITVTFPQTGFANYRQEWRQYDCLQNQLVTLYHGQDQIIGTVQGINDQGFLLLQEINGTIRTLASGEVSFHT